MADLRNYFRGRLGKSMKIEIQILTDWLQAGDGEFTRIESNAIDFKGKLTKYAPQNMDISILLQDEENCLLMILGKQLNTMYQVKQDKLIIAIPNGTLGRGVEISKKEGGTEINLQCVGSYPLTIQPAG